MKFDEETHKYTHKGEEYISVTTLIGLFFEKFNADEVIDTYYNNWQKDKKSKYYGLSKEEIKELWSNETETGSRFHKAIEDYLKGKYYDFTNLEPEFEQFLEFLNDYSSLLSIDSEILVYDEELKIAGTVDAIFYDRKTNSYVIIDWKRVKNIDKQGYKRAKYPISEVYDCNYYKYLLQLNIYRYLVKKRLKRTIKQLYLVQFHRDNPTYRVFKIPIKPSLTKKVLEEWKKRLNLTTGIRKQE